MPIMCFRCGKEIKEENGMCGRCSHVMATGQNPEYTALKQFRRERHRD